MACRGTAKKKRCWVKYNLFCCLLKRLLPGPLVGNRKAKLLESLSGCHRVGDYTNPDQFNEQGCANVYSTSG
jgi:hypothetical protein